MNFSGEKERGPGTNRLDFDGDPMTSSPSLPQFVYPCNAFSLCFLLFARWLHHNAKRIKHFGGDTCALTSGLLS